MRFFEYRWNKYYRSVVEFHYKFCDFIEKDVYVGTVIGANGLKCPIKPGKHTVMNVTAHFDDFPSPLPFEKARVNFIFNTSDALVLQCRDESGLRAPVRWFREDNKSFTVGTGQFMGRLEINIVDEADGGGYVCQAASHLGSPGSEARVDVIVNSGNGDGDIRTIRKPRFKDKTRNYFHFTGQQSSVVEVLVKRTISAATVPDYAIQAKAGGISPLDGQAQPLPEMRASPWIS
ncbi:hypothetical protein RR46_02957 [Papilio xuthus]|uniref:Ig-like domain-containing protein n=1 Tax=Papilio xuthus TaxID=66420 RepID=A0A194Q588_PAPXU|nr:hypothetical protein RR46_02957 [Papilio xuthus]